MPGDSGGFLADVDLAATLGGAAGGVEKARPLDVGAELLLALRTEPGQILLAGGLDGVSLRARRRAFHTPCAR